MNSPVRPREFHGMRYTREYAIWTRMLARCYNKNIERYPNYGGRGIEVCERWRDSFVNFFADMGPCPEDMSIERKLVNGNYEPDNCVWADEKTQSRNKTATRYITYNGLTLSLAEWCERTGLKHPTILMRLDREPAWTVGEALGFQPAPTNLRGWAAKKLQDPELVVELLAKKKAAQRSNPKGRQITYNGQTHCISEWSEITGVKRLTILMRLDRDPKWSVGQALGYEPAPKNTRWAT